MNSSQGKKMKKTQFLLAGMLVLSVSKVVVYGVDQTHTTLCSSCGMVLIGAQLFSAVRSSKEGKLFCLSCIKRTKGRKEGDSVSPQSAQKGSPEALVFSDGVFSPVSQSSPTELRLPVSSPTGSAYRKKHSSSAPVSPSMTPREAAEIGALLAERRKKKSPNLYEEHNLFETEPSDDKALNMIKLFELLHWKKKPDDQPVEEKYSCEFRLTKRAVDVVGPAGKRVSFEIPKSPITLLWKQAGQGVFLYTDKTGVTVRDLETNHVHEFPLQEVPVGVLKSLCPELGFDLIEPLTPYEEATRAYHERLAELPSPHFK